MVTFEETWRWGLAEGTEAMRLGWKEGVRMSQRQVVVSSGVLSLAVSAWLHLSAGWLTWLRAQGVMVAARAASPPVTI